MNKIKKGLGRGLSSLIGESKKDTSSTNKISVSSLVPSKFQPRKYFDEEKLNDLSYMVNRMPLISKD